MRCGSPSAGSPLRCPRVLPLRRHDVLFLLLPLLLLSLPACVGGHGLEAEIQSKEEEGHGGTSEEFGVLQDKRSEESSAEGEEEGEGSAEGPSEEGEEGEEGEAAEAEEGEEGQAGEEGEEHEPPEMVHIDIAIGCMLLGSIALQMGLLYLMNYPDDDIMKSSWEVISSTLSIFVSVLLFHAVHSVSDALEAHAGEEGESLPGGEIVHLGALLLCFLLIFVVMHLVIAQQIIADRSNSSPSAEVCNEAEDHSRRMSMFSTVETAKGKRKRITKSWAILLAHIASFSGIHVGTHAMGLFGGVPASTLLVPLLFLVLLFCLFRLSDWVRSSFMKDLSSEAHEEWDEEAEEAEKDIATIALSFLTIQAVRYCISGVLPNSGGLEEPQKVHPAVCIWTLMATGLIFYFLTSTMVAFIACDVQKTMQSTAETQKGNSIGTRTTLTLVDLDHSVHAGLDPLPVYVSRWYKICPKVLASCGSWCLLWACKWAQVLVPQPHALHFSHNSTAMFVVLALFVSLAMFMLILVLDSVADLEFTGPVCDVTIRAVIDSLGILVGFTWELSFSSGLEGIAELARGHGPHAALLCKLALAVIISLIVIPAWRSNILKKVLELRTLEEQNIMQHLEEDGEVDTAQVLAHEIEGVHHHNINAEYVACYKSEGQRSTHSHALAKEHSEEARAMLCEPRR